MTEPKPARKPLVLDIDGTYLKTDLLMESFWQALGHHPLRCLKLALRHLGNRAALKQALAGIAPIDMSLLPRNDAIRALADAAKAEGREVVLASGSDISLVTQLAETDGLDGAIFASDGTTNLTGRAKAEALVAAYGAQGFDYAGDSRVDLPVWQAADGAVIVGAHPNIAEKLRREGRDVTEIAGGWRKRDLLRGLRPHQWVKNVLLFLPMIAAHRLDAEGLVPVMFAIMAFCAAASAIYVVNDLLDLEADRLHPTKCRRPLAAGAVPILAAMLTAKLLAIFALATALLISPAMLGIVALYMGLSLAYSLKLKRMRWVDIATLASLYTLRVIAGAVAAEVVASGYLVVFIFPTFITLGCVKRLTELTLAKSDERLPGRGYGRPDRGDLLNVASLGTFGALLAFFVYSFTPAAQMLYANIWQLWLALIPIAAWLVRMILLGWKGKQDYDPIVFAMRDKYGLALIALTLAVMFVAATPG